MSLFGVRGIVRIQRSLHRIETGDIDRAGDLITYLEWCRAWPHLAHRADTASTPS